MTRQITPQICAKLDVTSKRLKQKETYFKIRQSKNHPLSIFYYRDNEIYFYIELSFNIFCYNLLLRCRSIDNDNKIDPRGEIDVTKLIFDVVYEPPHEYKNFLIDTYIAWFLKQNNAEYAQKAQAKILDNTFFTGWFNDEEMMAWLKGVSLVKSSESGLSFDYDVRCGYPDVSFSVHFKEGLTPETVEKLDSALSAFHTEWDETREKEGKEEHIHYISDLKENKKTNRIKFHIDFGSADPVAIEDMMAYLDKCKLGITKIILS